MQPKFNSGLLFDIVQETSNRKINGLGAINIFRAWGFPCRRNATLLLSLLYLKKGANSGDILLGKLRGTEETKLTSFTVTSNINNAHMSAAIPLQLSFKQQGRYYFKSVFHDYRSVLKIHFVVHLQKWPVFSEEELTFVRESPTTYNSIRANIHCDKCSHAYIFEENILDVLPPPGGVMRFPESGEFRCTQCQETIHLKDIQGQMRFSLKEIITSAMKVK
ncbi:MAG TPA: hypothetical protein G4O10_09700 [Dehalococcoidia bacterium]|nr:hypothetical protein [Dehalococcoidia bacterium]